MTRILIIITLVAVLVMVVTSSSAESAPSIWFTCPEDSVLEWSGDTNSHVICTPLDNITDLAAEQGYNAALERLMRGEPLGPSLKGNQ